MVLEKAEAPYGNGASTGLLPISTIDHFNPSPCEKGELGGRLGGRALPYGGREDYVDAIALPEGRVDVCFPPEYVGTCPDGRVHVTLPPLGAYEVAVILLDVALRSGGVPT